MAFRTLTPFERTQIVEAYFRKKPKDQWPVRGAKVVLTTRLGY